MASVALHVRGTSQAHQPVLAVAARHHHLASGGHGAVVTHHTGPRTQAGEQVALGVQRHQISFHCHKRDRPSVLQVGTGGIARDNSSDDGIHGHELIAHVCVLS